MNNVLVLALGAALLLSGMATAQTTDPVDRNHPGPFLGGGLSFGQANRVGKGSPGTAWFLGIEPGYVMARDTWARFEISFELGTGRLGYKAKEDGVTASVDVDVVYYGLIKAGYGTSMGNNVFAVWRAGVGPANVSVKSKASGVTAKADDLSAFMYQLGADIVSPMTDSLSIFGGLHFRMMNFSIDEYKVAGTTVTADDNEQVNMMLVQVGARLRF